MDSMPSIHLLLIISTFPSLLVSCFCASQEKAGIFPVDAVYQLGDSTSDTGNLIRIVIPNSTAAVVARLPYGETFGKPAGRFSDGLLIVDYFKTIITVAGVIAMSKSTISTVFILLLVVQPALGQPGAIHDNDLRFFNDHPILVLVVIIALAVIIVLGYLAGSWIQQKIQVRRVRMAQLQNGPLEMAHV